MISASPDVSFPDDDDRFFSAVRYLLGEMSAEEAERFEVELDESQPLRELVTEAAFVLEAACAVEPVHLSNDDAPAAVGEATVALVSSAHPSASNERSFRWNPPAWAALAAGLLLAATVGVGVTFWPRQEPVANREEISPAGETQLAAAWARRVAAQDDALTTLWDEGLLTTATADDPAPEDAFDRLLTTSAAAPPDWMLHALSAEQEEDSARPPL